MASLIHEGTKRHSGRYPWGSGKNPQQRNKSFLGYVKKLSDEGLSDDEIARGMGMKRSELQAKRSNAKADIRRQNSSMATRLKDKGMSNSAIARRMGVNESTVRSWLDPVLQARADISVATANMLRKAIDKKGVIDIGLGVEANLGISRIKLKNAINLLEQEGYHKYFYQVEQAGTGKKTTIQALAHPDAKYRDAFNKDKQPEIKSLTDHSEDGGRSYLGLEPINSVSRSRIQINYKEDGGASKDGVIELRKGVDDISLGTKRYAQVRIGVDGDKYMKGMALYSDNMPKGVDIIYNTNKKKGTPDDHVFKPMEDDADNPFGSVVRQKHYITPAGKTIPNAAKMLELKQLGSEYTYSKIAKQLDVDEATVRKAIGVKALNVLNEEGDWTEWSRNISSQVLSKQSPALAKKQLDLARDIKLDELDEISKLTNPAVRQALLKTFADEADSQAVHLKAAALPRQANKVILPIPALKENEVYAPSFNNGEKVVLIRHPHGGIFEIPEVTVNNKNAVARSILGDAIDGIGIHPNVAAKLSGADFDGDTVLVIPNRNKDIRTAPTLKALKDFDNKEAYPPRDGLKTIDGGIYNAKTGQVDYGGKKPNPAPKQRQMGDVSNLITDMTIKGANTDEIARAVKHSMVIIDAEKHSLDYKKSAIDNGIAELKKKYQGRTDAGASTLISRAKSEKRVPFREEGALIGPISKRTGKPTRVYIDPKTGKKLYETVDDSFVNAKGKTIPKTSKITKMEFEDDAHRLSSGTKIESIYADHANEFKAMGNTARKMLLETPNQKYSPSARETYAPEVARLKAALRVAYQNKPRERQAQLLANQIIAMKKAANPHMDRGDLKKIKGQALEEARSRMNAKKEKIVISDREWAAIQLGAISHNTLTQILSNTDLNAIKTRATPRTAYVMTPAKVAKAKMLAASGYTTAEIASALGVSTSSVQDTIN